MHGTLLAASLARLRLQIEVAVLRRLNAGAGLGELRPSGVYVREPAALERLAAGTLRPRGSHRSAAAALEEALEQARQREGAGSEDLSALAARFALTPQGCELLLLAAALELDLDSRDLLQALAGRRLRELPLDVCADVLAPHEPHQLAAAIAHGTALRASRLLTIEGEGLGATVAARGHLLRFLAGDRAVPSALAALVTLHPRDAELGCALPLATEQALADVGQVLRAAEAGGRALPAVALRGPRGAGRLAAAHLLARSVGRPLVVASVPELLSAERQRKAAALADVLATARLLEAAVLLRDVDALWDDSGAAEREHVALLREHRGPLLLALSSRGGHVDLGRPVISVALGRAALDERERAWRVSLERLAPSSSAELQELAPELSGRYVIGPGAIAEVVAEATAYAAAVGGEVTRDGLEAAVGRRLSLRLGTFGTVVARKSRFSELVLPDDVIEPLRDMLAMVRERSLILEKWGFQRHLGISRGVSALFSGEPGTGKTMAASVIASELGLELVRIDLSAVVSKFVGETEKNLAKIFDEAQDAHAMLLFDEADSLFGKRTELRSAQDRFANLEVNYILQRMETFDGVSVLTTNAENAIDPALQRRLSFRIRFPEPEVDEREQLWRRLLPPSVASDDIDFKALAERFDMTGGYIKNSVVRAAVIAARAGRELSAEDLWIGAHSEYAEMGKVMPQVPMPGRRS